MDEKLKETEEMLGRKLKKTESLMFEMMHDNENYTITKDKNGNLLFLHK